MGVGASSSSSSAKNYYADIACVICAGPVDRLEAIYLDGKKAWPESGPGLDRAGQPNPVAITVPAYGTLWFYWGEADQTLDATGEAFLAAGGHPPYRRQAVAVLKGFLFGQNRTSAPNLEFVVRRRPRQDLISGAAAELDADGQANPLCILAELLTDPVHGLGLPLSLFDQSSWQAVADDLHASAALTYLSPAFESASSARARMDDVRDYYDGWFRWSASGRIVAGRYLHDAAPPAFTAANTVTADDLTEEADLDAEAWADTRNEAVVKFINGAAEFKDDSFTATSGFNRAVVGEPRQESLDRPYITRAAQAARHAAEFLKLEAEPAFAGKLSVRGVKAAGLPVGTVFRFVHDVLGLDLIARVTGRTYAGPPVETAEIRFATERGLSAVRALTGASIPEAPADPAAERVPRFQFIQPPSALLGDNYRLLVLCTRSAAVTVGVRVWFQQADAVQFQELGGQTAFAVAGRLLADYPAGEGDDNTETLRLAVLGAPPSPDLEAISEGQTEDQVEDGALLLFLLSAADPRDFEILSVRGLRLSGGEWLAQVRRAQCGTHARAFAADDLAWVIRRDDLRAYTHESFPALSRAQAVATFRLQGITPFGEGDLTNPDLCPDISYAFREAYPDNVESFTIEGRRLAWAALDDLYIAGYRIRYHLGPRQVWADALPLHDGLLTDSPYEPATLPSGPVTFLLKAVDTAGAESAAPAVIVTDLGDPVVANIVETYDLRAAGWPGTLGGGTIDGGNQLAADSITLMWAADASLPMWAADSSALMWPAVTYSAMEYITQLTVTDVLAGSTLTLAAEVLGDPWSITYRESSHAPMWTADGAALMWAADPSALMWTVAPWTPWPGSVETPRATRFEFRVTTGESVTQGRVNAFAGILDAPDVAETFDNIVTTPGGTRLPLTLAYRVIRNVQLTVQTDGNGAISARVVDKDAALGPLVIAYDSAGAAVAGLLDAAVRGY